MDGGQLGWRKGSQLPQFILELVTKMKPGEVSAPVRTPSGFHIVKLNERRGGEAQVIVNQIHVRHILLKPNELDDDATVREKLAKLRERILNGEDFAGIASATSEDPGSAPDGGDLGWSGPGTFVPEFDKAIANLKTNEISEPFKTRYGWHIVQMLGTRTYDSTDDVRRQKAFAAIRESKADEETELWLRRLARRGVRRNQDVVRAAAHRRHLGRAGRHRTGRLRCARAEGLAGRPRRRGRRGVARANGRGARDRGSRYRRTTPRARPRPREPEYSPSSTCRWRKRWWPGRLDVRNAPYVIAMLDRACDGCLRGEFAAMVTAPVQKSTLMEAGFAFTGHTEYLAARTGAALPVMMLQSASLRVALVTTHLRARRRAARHHP